MHLRKQRMKSKTFDFKVKIRGQYLETLVRICGSYLDTIGSTSSNQMLILINFTFGMFNVVCFED